MHTSRPVALIVEDEVMVRIMLAEALREAGYIAIEAVDAEEGLEALRASPEVRVVITDIRLPGSIDGIALARQVRSERPDAKIIVVSGDLRAVGPAEYDGVGAVGPRPLNIYGTERVSPDGLIGDSTGGPPLQVEHRNCRKSDGPPEPSKDVGPQPLRVALAASRGLKDLLGAADDRMPAP
jgi:CheY-like chemotaxis protein